MTSLPPRPRSSGQSPTVLAIDTTAGLCSVALLSPAGVARQACAMTQGHSQQVLGLIGRVLSEAAVEPATVDAIGFGAGPGSFTGLRVACGVAQGLGFGWDRPLVAVDAMRTLAVQAAADAGPDPAGALICVALDVRMGEVCHAVFRLGDCLEGRWPEPLAAPRLGSPAAARDAFAGFEAARLLLAGDGFDACEALADWSKERTPACRSSGAVQPDAWAVARLAARGLADGRAVDAALAAPTYLRDKVALDVDEQAALRAARLGPR